ncbi:MAG: DUF4258 domain-containing protein [Planctomycetes bacterium]|nr:DUF4258 domain-containing protein [Planctomycetota bacterium]
MSGSREIDWPAWWDWELELSSHILKRRIDRGFSEVDLRRMMAAATRVREDRELGRWVVESVHGLRPWEVIVEPDARDRLLVVITAYPGEAP